VLLDDMEQEYKDTGRLEIKLMSALIPLW
jgi:hypothetical protein